MPAGLAWAALCRVEMWRGGCRSNISVSASFVWRCLSGATMTRFHIPLIEPDMKISRIRLSDKTSRLHPRHVVPKPAQAHEPEVPVKVREWIRPALASPDLVLEAQPPAQPRSVRFNFFTRPVVSCQVPARTVNAWTFSTMRLMLFRDGRYPRYAFPVLAEYIRPNVYPRKSNFPSGTLQIRVFSSLTVSLSLPMIWRSCCNASSALPLLHRITRSSA